MSMTGLRSFDSTVHATVEWLDDLISDSGCDDRQQAYHAMRSVLHAVRDRLIVDEATDLGAQLPMLVRGFYYEGWRPAATPTKERSREEFLGHVDAELSVSPGQKPIVDPAEATIGVFRLLTRRISVGEVEHVFTSLPSSVRELWQEAVAVGAPRE